MLCLVLSSRGIGCIFTEMVSGLATFPGMKDAFDQLDRIWRVRYIGTKALRVHRVNTITAAQTLSSVDWLKQPWKIKLQVAEYGVV